MSLSLTYSEAYDLLTKAIVWNTTVNKRGMQAVERLPYILCEYIRAYKLEPYQKHQDIECPDRWWLPYKNVFEEIWWDLFIWRVVTFGLEPWDSGTTNYKHFRLTEWGHRLLAENALTPYDRTGFLASINSRIAADTNYRGLDPITCRYVGEALDCFQKGLYLAALVMIGVAAEALLLEMASKLAVKLPAKENNNLEQTLNSSGMKKLINSVKGSLSKYDNELGGISHTVESVMDLHLMLIKRHRDECAHPKDIVVTREIANACLLLFHQLSCDMYRLNMAIDDAPPFIHPS